LVKISRSNIFSWFVVIEIVIENDKVKQDFDVQKKKLEEYLFEKKKLEFVKSDSKLGKNLIGSLNNNNKAVLENLKNLKNQIEIKYNQQKQNEYNQYQSQIQNNNIKTIQPCAMEIGIICFNFNPQHKSQYHFALIGEVGET